MPDVSHSPNLDTTSVLKKRVAPIIILGGFLTVGLTSDGLLPEL